MEEICLTNSAQNEPDLKVILSVAGFKYFFKERVIMEMVKNEL